MKIKGYYPNIKTHDMKISKILEVMFLPWAYEASKNIEIPFSNTINS